MRLSDWTLHGARPTVQLLLHDSTGCVCSYRLVRFLRDVADPQLADSLTSCSAMGSTWTLPAPAAAQRSAPWLLEWHEAPLCASDTQACSSGWASPSWLVAMPAKNQMINCWNGRYPQSTMIFSHAKFSVAVQGTREVHNMHMYMRYSSTTSEDFCELVLQHHITPHFLMVFIRLA